jgi:hypothetical protein
VSLPAGPVVLSLVSAAPVDDSTGDHLGDQKIALIWRGPCQPRLPDTVVLYHSSLPPLTVTWLQATVEPKQILYSTLVAMRRLVSR